MIKIETFGVYGLNHALRAMRNPYDSWARSDSQWRATPDKFLLDIIPIDPYYVVGEADAKLANSLIQAGSEHATFLRMIVCYANITAPRYWWTEADRYRIGKEQISCSTMHTLMRHHLRPEDFSGEVFTETLDHLNNLMDAYKLETDPEVKQAIWKTIIENLPQGYNQTRTVMMSYQALRAMCHQRKGHKLSEWHDFIDWAKTLPESWMLVNDD